ncbi:MAG: hypothetical protein DME91_08810, partial [Verrucomicrobia bacterium]
MLCRILTGLISIFLVGNWSAYAMELSSSVNAEDGWKLAIETKAVTIYSRPGADSRLKEFRAIGPVDAPT